MFGPDKRPVSWAVCFDLTCLSGGRRCSLDKTRPAGAWSGRGRGEELSKLNEASVCGDGDVAFSEVIPAYLGLLNCAVVLLGACASCAHAQTNITGIRS